MGCDIHLHVEIKDEETLKWRRSELFRKPHKGWGEKNDFVYVNPYSNRDYNLFAALVGIRDYSPGNNKISEPKGLPNDCSIEVQKESDDWDCDGHSHSWNTMKELYDFQKNSQKVKHSGYVSKEDAEALDKKGITPSSSSWWQGGNISEQTWREWEDIHDPLKYLIQEIEDYIDKAEFCVWCKHEEWHENIRIVYWFDN